jgi:prepilin-type N-terminal cleavage/methylation domain-containing protein
MYKRRKSYTRDGFTLIELLVVIAIIGVLASVVIASVNVARDKAANAAIKSNLNNVRGQAEIVYDDNNGFYDPVCADPRVMKAVNAAAIITGATEDYDLTNAQVAAVPPTPATANCHSSPTGWAISVPLKIQEGTSLYWCVDNNGVSGGRVNILPADAEACPAS